MSFAGHSLQTVIVRVGLIFLGMIAGVFHARWLGPEGVGIIALVVLVKNFSFRYGNLGFGSAFAYFVANKTHSMKRMVRLNWAISTVLSMASIALLLLVWQQPFSPWKEVSPETFHLALVLIPFFFLNMHSQRILSGKLKIGTMNTANLINGAINVVGLLCLVVLLEWGITGAVYALILAEIMTSCYLLISCRNRIVSNGIHRVVPDDNAIRPLDLNDPAATSGISGIHSNASNAAKSGNLIGNLWRYGRWNYLLSFVNFLIEELPLMILTHFAQTIGAIGIFSKARELGRQTRTISIPISQVLFPYTAASESPKAINRTNAICRTYLVFLILVMIVSIPLVKPVILLLYGQEFLPSVTIFYYLIPGMIFWPLGNFMTIHVAAAGKPRLVFLWNLIPLSFTLGVTILLIPRYQLAGAAIGTSVILVFLTVIRFLVYRRETGASFSDVFIIKRADINYMIQVIGRLRGSRRSHPPLETHLK